jgi:hypothetical protein
MQREEFVQHLRIASILSLVFASTIATAPSLKADITLPLDTWERFSWFDGGILPSPTTPSPWIFTTSSPTQLRVTDCCLIGDEFRVVITGDLNTTLDTSAINPALDGVDSGASTGPASWADSDLSHLAVDLGPGSYSVSIDVIRNALRVTSGGAFIEAATAVPEPGSLGFLLPVLLGAAFLGRKRFSKTA